MTADPVVEAVARAAYEGYVDTASSRSREHRAFRSVAAAQRSQMKRDVARDVIAVFLREARKMGWRLVPVEPTKQMILDAETAVEDHKDEGWDSCGGEGSHTYTYFTPGVEAAVHKAMLNAAPKSPWDG